MGFLSSIGKAVKGVVNSVSGGDVLGLAGGLLGAQSTNSAAAAAASTSNKFTKEMMQNRHQWEANDLIAAGFNPVLTAGAAPSMGHSAQAPVVNPVDSVHSAMNSALASRRLKAEIEQIHSATDLNRASAVSHGADAALKATEARRVSQGIDIARPKADIARVVQQGTAKFSGVANSAAGLARQVARYPGLAIRKHARDLRSVIDRRF